MSYIDTSVIVAALDSQDPRLKRTRGLLEEKENKVIFRSCFSKLKCDKVVVVMQPTKRRPKYLGKDRIFKPNTVHLYLRTTLKLKALGQCGGWAANINPPLIRKNAAKVKGGNVDVLTANVIAHELGLHGIAGTSWYNEHPWATEDFHVGLYKATPTLTTHVGYFSRGTCDEMIDELDVK